MELDCPTALPAPGRPGAGIDKDLGFCWAQVRPGEGGPPPGSRCILVAEESGVPAPPLLTCHFLSFRVWGCSVFALPVGFHGETPCRGEFDVPTPDTRAGTVGPGAAVVEDAEPQTPHAELPGLSAHKSGSGLCGDGRPWRRATPRWMEKGSGWASGRVRGSCVAGAGSGQARGRGPAQNRPPSQGLMTPSPFPQKGCAGQGRFPPPQNLLEPLFLPLSQGSLGLADVQSETPAARDGHAECGDSRTKGCSAVCTPVLGPRRARCAR